MRMDNVASAKINSFGNSPKADFVPPSEQLITLTIGQLQDIVIQAVEKAIQPLQEEIAQLRSTVATQDEKMAALEATEEHDVNRICLDIAFDRQRISRLEKVEPQPLQKDRGEILRALLVANGCRMLAKDARLKMHLSKQTFSMLIASMGDYIEIKPLHSDKRKNVLMLK